MSAYKHILVGLDLNSEESTKVSQKAMEFAVAAGAKLSLVHVVEALALAYAMDVPTNIESLQKSLRDHATTQMNKILEDLRNKAPNLSIECEVTVGPTAQQLHQLATDRHADLIIVGSHGRHGLSLIFGSTSNDVLHGAECDVLAVRV